jgi:hypothetical protein
MATIQSLIAAKRAKIAARVGSESDLTDELIKDLAQLNQAGLDANGAAPTVVDSASIGAGVDSSTDIDAIKALLTNILDELSKQKEFEDLIVQDTVGTVFIRREQLNESTDLRTITIENFDGTVGAPVGAITTIKQIKSNSIVTRNYYAKIAGAGFAAGDSLATMQIVNGETTAVTLLGWFNITQQTSIAAPPTTAIEGYEDLVQELLAQIVAQLPPSLGSKLSAQSLSVVLGLDAVLPLPLGAATDLNIRELIDTLGILADVSIPADEQADATVKGLLRLAIKRLADLATQQLAAIGAANETDILSEPRDFGSLKAVLRGQWQDLRDIIGSQADNTQINLADSGSLKALIRALGELSIDGTQIAGLYDQTTGQRATILAPGTAASNDPALVVAISPNTPVRVRELPGTMQADLAAIKASNETIAANTANISRYQFNLAETTAGVVFLVRTDAVTGATTSINIATGLAFAPGSIELTDPIAPATAANTKSIEPNEFFARTTVAGQWAVDDVLTRVLIVDTATNTSTTIWQGATGVLLTTVPVLGADVEDTNKTQVNLLKAQPTAGTPIVTEALPTGSGLYGWLSYIRSSIATAIGNAADVLIPATVNDPSSVKGLLRFVGNAILGRLLQGSQPLTSALATTRARKTTAVGWTSTGVLNQNILDGSGAGVATDVRDYDSMQVVITTAAVANLKVLLQVASDSGFTVGVNTLEWIASPSGIISTAQTTLASSTTSRFNVDLVNANYIRIVNNFIGSAAFGLGSTVAYTLSQTPIPSKLSLTAGNSLAANLQPNLSVVDLASSTIVSSATTAQIVPTSGVSFQVEYDVTSITGADTVCNLSIEESYNSGLNWRKIYTFEPITFAKGARVYKSDLLPLTGDRLRYVQTITGTTPSITRSILRTQSNLAVPTAIGTNRQNLFNLLNAGIDLPLYGRTRRMTVTNRTAILHYLQIHDKATAIVLGDIPIEIFQLPATSSLPFTVADLGEHGTILGAAINPRVAISTTFNTYTAPSAIAANLFHLFVESV